MKFTPESKLFSLNKSSFENLVFSANHRRVVVALGLLLACDSPGAVVTWDNSGSSPSAPTDGSTSLWSTIASNWSNGAADSPWNNANSDTAVFGSGNGAAGVVNLGSNITVGGIVFNAATSGNYNIAPGSGPYGLTLGGNSVSVNAGAAISAIISGGSGLTKSGTGTLLLSGSNNYTGVTTINAGILSITLWTAGGSASSIGSAANGNASNPNIIINGGTLQYAGTAATQLSSRIISIGTNGATLDASGGTGWGISAPAFGYTGSGARTLTLTGTTGGLQTAGGTLSAAVTDSGGATSIVKNGNGGWSISGISTYTGSTTINSGVLFLTSGSNRLPVGTTLYISQSGTLNLQGQNQTVAVLMDGTSGGGTVINNSGIATFTVGSGTYGGILKDASATKILNFSKTGSGTLYLSGTSAYSGPTTIADGVLAIKTVATGIIWQSLGIGTTVNLGVAATSSGTMQYKGSTGTLDKNIYALGNGLNTVQNNGSGLLTLSGSLVKNGTILALDGGANGIKVTGTISGNNTNSDLYITGGTTTLTAQNTYNGPTWVYGGGVLINGNASGALPTSTNLILGGTDNSRGTFDLGGNGQVVATLNSTGTNGSNLITNSGAAATLTVNNGGSFGGVIQDGAGKTALSVTGGNLVLHGANTYTGATVVSGGTLSINGTLANTALSVGVGAVLAGSGTTNGNVVADGSISGSLTFENDATLHSGATATARAFNGNIANDGIITSDITIQSGKTLSGSGTTANVTVQGGVVNGSGLKVGSTTLNGNSQLSGTITASQMTVQSGNTALTGVVTSAGTISVIAGATLTNTGTAAGNMSVAGLLTGTGAIEGSVELSGTLAPGSGITRISGDFTMKASSLLTLAVSGTTAGVDYSRIEVGGLVTLNGTLDLTTLTGLTRIGDQVTLILNSGDVGVSGSFSSVYVNGELQTVANSSFTYAGIEYQIYYNMNSDSGALANDVTLAVIPEPSTWAIIIGGMGMLIGFQRTRKANMRQ